jgi:hypothetical protein
VPGAFFRTFPRHRVLISVNKVHTDGTGVFFPSAEDLLRYLADFAAKQALKFVTSHVSGTSRGTKSSW